MHLKLKRVVVAMAVAGIGLGLSATANAGRVVLTGHDNDLHSFFGSPAGDETTTTAAELTYVRAGSTLPVLVIDDGTQAVSLISNIIGAANVVTRTVSAVTAADFDPSLYSAFVVASVTTCGGCDNPVGTGTTLSAFSAAISNFFNAGGGILGETVATDPLGYAYVPQAAGSPSPIGDTDGFVATAEGTAAMPGFLAVNGDQTHNIFSEPGTGGVSDAYHVAERFAATGAPVTIFAEGTIVCTGADCVITGGGGTVPEPGTLTLLALALAGMGAFFRRRFR